MTSNCTQGFEFLAQACSAAHAIDVASLSSSGDPDAPASSCNSTQLNLPVLYGQGTYEAAGTSCQCNKAYFNLHVGCTLCQPSSSTSNPNVTWSQWTKGCAFGSTTLLPSLSEEDFDPSVIPAWARINTKTDDTFDVHAAQTVANTTSSNSTSTHPSTPHPWSTFQITLPSVLGALLLLSLLLNIYHLFPHSSPSSPKERMKWNVKKRGVVKIRSYNTIDGRSSADLNLGEGEGEMLLVDPSGGVYPTHAQSPGQGTTHRGSPLPTPSPQRELIPQEGQGQRTHRPHLHLRTSSTPNLLSSSSSNNNNSADDEGMVIVTAAGDTFTLPPSSGHTIGPGHELWTRRDRREEPEALTPLPTTPPAFPSYVPPIPRPRRR